MFPLVVCNISGLEEEKICGRGEEIIYITRNRFKTSVVRNLRLSFLYSKNVQLTIVAQQGCYSKSVCILSTVLSSDMTGGH